MTNSRRQRKSALIGYLFIAPSIAILAAVGFYPVLKTLSLSFYDASFLDSASRFIGLDNYKRLLNDVWFKISYRNTWGFTALSVALETAIGLGIAVLLDKNISGRKWVRASVLIPWAIPTVISASMWQWLFNADFGLINYLLERLGVISSSHNWLADSGSAMWAVIVADVWKTTPFMALIVLAAMQTIPEDIYEAADIDGVRPGQRFMRITLPMVFPALLTAFLLRALDAFRVFDLVYVLTGGGPANSTEVLSSYAYKTIFSSAQVGYGAAMATVMALSVLVLALVLQMLQRRAYARIEGR
ncbi:carbohydrate ABC transporter permease [Cohnella sp.]|uniref:carbohydrate ABC transporter permease n=1 Tax=Cohnella sp. TaxID=1883426 RepID=UPI003566C3FE